MSTFVSQKNVILWVVLLYFFHMEKSAAEIYSTLLAVYAEPAFVSKSAKIEVNVNDKDRTP